MKIENWKTVRLGDVCEIVMGTSPTGETISNNSDLGIEFHQGKTCFGNTYLNKSNLYTSAPIRFAEAGNVIMSVRAPVGDSNITPRKIAIGRGLCTFNTADSFERIYLFYYLNSQIEYLKSKSTGSTFKAVSKDVIADLKIPLPPLATQKHIAAVLDKCTEVIAKHKLMLEKYDTLIKSQFVEMFGANQYPVMPVSNLCDFITKGTTPPTSEITEEYFEDAIPYFKVYNLSFNGELLFTEKTQYISRKIHETVLARSKVFPNDVLMNIVGPPLGKFSLIPKNYTESNINQAIAIFRAKEKVIPLYLLHALMFPDTLQPIINSAVGIRQQNLSLEQCRNLKIPVPPLALQEKFAQFVRAVDAQKAKAQQSLDKAETLYKALMQEYFGA